MVSDKGDIPDEDDVKPYHSAKCKVLEELLDRGETQVHLRNGQQYELHGYDTYLFNSPGRDVHWVYTQNEDDDEVWFDAGEIVSLEQH